MANCFKVVIILGFFSSLAMALDTAKIEALGKKAVLEQADMAQIDAFVASAVQEIIDTEDFGNIAEVRAAVVANSKSEQAQYKPAFAAAVAKNLPQGVEKAKAIKDQKRQANALINLMILMESLKNPALVDSAASMLGSDNVAVRYWAVRNIASLAVENQKAAQVGMAKLGGMIGKETSADVLEQIARFGATAKINGAKKLLFDVADMRIKGYQDWSLMNFEPDGAILSLLASSITAGTENDPAAVRFAQLLAYAMGRYCNDENLSKAKKAELGEVLMATEAGALAKLGIPQTSIKKALTERGGTAAVVLVEYKSLYGDDGASGKINTVLKVKSVSGLPVKDKK